MTELYLFQGLVTQYRANIFINKKWLMFDLFYSLFMGTYKTNTCFARIILRLKEQPVFPEGGEGDTPS